MDLGAMAIKSLLHIPQSFSITGASPSDCLVSYPGLLSGESYPSTEMQSVYSTASVDKLHLLYVYLYIFKSFLFLFLLIEPEYLTRILDII